MWRRHLAECQREGPVGAGNAAPLGDPAPQVQDGINPGSLHGVEPCIRWRGVNRDELAEVDQQPREDGWSCTANNGLVIRNHKHQVRSNATNGEACCLRRPKYVYAWHGDPLTSASGCKHWQHFWCVTQWPAEGEQPCCTIAFHTTSWSTDDQGRRLVAESHACFAHSERPNMSALRQQLAGNFLANSC